MEISPKFLKYEENQDQASKEKGFLGVITFSTHNNTEIHNYKVQQGKDGKGFFIVPFSTKMNERWFKAHSMDSNYMSEELEAFLRKSVNAYYNAGQATQLAFDDSSVPF